ncbi:MAG: hypothetical protein ABIH41_06405 [Nanoarchaeota archaeon]
MESSIKAAASDHPYLDANLLRVVRDPANTGVLESLLDRAEGLVKDLKVEKKRFWSSPHVDRDEVGDIYSEAAEGVERITARTATRPPRLEGRWLRNFMASPGHVGKGMFYVDKNRTIYHRLESRYVLSCALGHEHVHHLQAEANLNLKGRRRDIDEPPRRLDRIFLEGHAVAVEYDLSLLFAQRYDDPIFTANCRHNITRALYQTYALHCDVNGLTRNDRGTVSEWVSGHRSIPDVYAIGIAAVFIQREKFGDDVVARMLDGTHVFV